MLAGLPVVLPVGSIEAHSDHLPLGNDTFKIERACLEAARIEEAVILPPLYYTDVKPMKLHCGAIDMDVRVILKLVEKICDEVGRNGFRKILIASGHGGNGHWMGVLRSHLADRCKNYCLYTFYVSLLADSEKDGRLISGNCPFDFHGGELETSIALHLFPELTHMERHEIAGEKEKSPDLGGALTPFDFPIAWPKALSGDPSNATAEKGKILFESEVSALVSVLRKIKADTTTPEFKLEYEQRQNHRA